jgi:Uma2 family endonuclease
VSERSIHSAAIAAAFFLVIAMATIVFEEQIEIPMNLHSLVEFRRWAMSDGFPDRGRIDYLAGRIEVDVSPEDFFCHGTLKGEIYGVLYQQVKQRQLGYLVTDSTRVSCPLAELSAEPDIVFVSHDTLSRGRARLVPKATGEPERYVEIEGAPDFVAEIVSDRSVAKDTQQLPKAYYRAGVREFWLADARSEPLRFQIYRRGPLEFEKAEADRDGYQRSSVFGCSFRLDGLNNEQGHWSFDLRARD